MGPKTNLVELLRPGTGGGFVQYLKTGIHIACLIFAVVVGALFYSAPETLIPLPAGVHTKDGKPPLCSHPGCNRQATRIQRDAARELVADGQHSFSVGESSGAYCDEHTPTFGEFEGFGAVFLMALVAYAVPAMMLILPFNFIPKLIRKVK